MNICACSLQRLHLLGCVGFPLHGEVCVAVRGLSVVLRYFGGVRSLVFGTRRLPRSSVAIGRRSALKICSVPVSWPGTALFAWVGVHQFSARCSCCAYSTAPGIHSSRLGLHLPPPELHGGFVAVHWDAGPIEGPVACTLSSCPRRR